ncbi:MAG: right-handed parallel beta-helix repeat-containing protein [Methanomassiliicoccales archaeon]|nr:MAG: right-handed parallel beta-helix repeat-containing protein [Methanomassiliicoccales archaeon]
MRRKLMSFAVCFLLLLTFFIGIDMDFEIASTARGATLYVGGGGSGNYSTIQDAVDAANPGDTVYAYRGKYLENVVVDKTINLTGEDRDNTTIDGSLGDDVIRVEAHWVNISGFRVNKGSTGIELADVHNCKVFNNNVSTNDNQGIWLLRSIDNEITSNKALYNYMGICLTDSLDNDITGNNVSENDYGISLNDGSGNNITNNILYANNDFGMWLHGSTNNNSIVNNNISLGEKTGIYLSGSAGNDLQGNTMKYNGIRIGGDEVRHWNTHNIDTSNTVNGKPVQYWKNQTGGIVPLGAGQVILANCSNVKIEGQELTNGTVGIQLGFSSSNIIVGNNASSNNFEGIHLFKSNENTIISNFVSSNLQYSGINIDYSEQNNITDNYVSLNIVGIDLYNSDYNLITYNTVFLNDFRGISLRYSSMNGIIGNTVSSNGDYGIYLKTDSSNNSVYHNNIIDNAFQAYDDTNKSNQWDNGYPSGGNYWSDFDNSSEGAYDDYQGINQDVSGSDGIVDNGTIGGGGTNPYAIDNDSQDNYPLINLTKNYIFLYQGWNLISNPRIQPDTNPGTVLSSITGHYKSIQWYNTTDTNDPWKHNCTTKPQHLNDFDSIDPLIGFWIYITEPGGVLLEYFGARPSVSQNIPLHTGWNMVGFPSINNKNRSAALNNLTFGIEVDAIWAFDGSKQSWEAVGPGNDFIIGKGYWIHATQDCTWEVPL